jgi:hypothetical protein
VKCHQDESNTHIVTTEEALNIEADEITHIGRKLQYRKENVKFPANKINFKLNNWYVNSHLSQNGQLSYIDKYQWPSQTMCSIWWPVYYQSLSKLSNPDKLRSKKFVNNVWPTLDREQKYYNRSTSYQH